MSRTDPGPMIDRAEPARRRAALEILFSEVPGGAREQQIDALLQFVATGGGSLEGLFEVHAGGAPLGAILAMPQPGRSAMVWPPRVVPGMPAETADGLLRAVDAYLRAQGVRIAQAQLEAPGGPDEACLLRGGFELLAELVYLVATPESFPLDPPVMSLEWEPYNETNHTRLGRLIDATYEGSLDCPALDGVRRAEDVLASYRATGSFRAEHWILVAEAGRDIGCLITTDHPARNMFELIYVGLVPGARGRGFGEQLVRYSQWLARRAGRAQLVTAVDAANAPALRMYARTGFTTWDRRSTYLRIFPD